MADIQRPGPGEQGGFVLVYVAPGRSCELGEPRSAADGTDVYLWDLADTEQVTVEKSLGDVFGAAGPTVPLVQLSGTDAGERLLEGRSARPGGTALVCFGPQRAREAARLLERASEGGLRARLVPPDIDLQREAIVQQLWDLYELTRLLRRECPWDRKQTQESIVPYTVEEVYELVDTVKERAAAGGKGEEAVRSELGDLLYQVYFIACLAEEEHLYDLGEVAAGIHAKLVRRHPHIFGDVSAETSDDVRRTWDTIKKESEGREGIFHDVPRSFPALLMAQKLQQRAAAVGFDWDEPIEVLDKLKEETAEIEQELAAGDQEGVAAELGDLLFAVVNLARKLKVDPELALRGSALRFRERVEQAADIAGRDGRVFEDLELDEQESYYRHAKEGLRP